VKLRFQVTIVGEAEKGSLNSQVHFTLQRGGVIRLLIDKSSQIGVPTGRKTKSVPTIATTPHPWLQLGLVGCKSCIVPWQHRPSSDMGLTPPSSLWTRVDPSSSHPSPKTVAFLFFCVRCDDHYQCHHCQWPRAMLRRTALTRPNDICYLSHISHPQVTSNGCRINSTVRQHTALTHGTLILRLII
jgi:hypothetical protein